MSRTKIQTVAPGSPAHRAGVRPGETLAAINGHPIIDVLDYKFYSYDPDLVLTLDQTGRYVGPRLHLEQPEPAGHQLARVQHGPVQLAADRRDDRQQHPCAGPDERGGEDAVPGLEGVGHERGDRAHAVQRPHEGGRDGPGGRAALLRRPRAPGGEQAGAQLGLGDDRRRLAHRPSAAASRG